MVTREGAIETAKAFISACKGRLIVFDRAILFGSIVNGKMNAESDIDLALFSASFKGNAFEDWHLLSPINIHFTDIEPHPYPTYLIESDDPFIKEIIKTGIDLNVAG